VGFQYDRLIKISAAGSRKALLWPPQDLLWSDFVAKLAAPVRSTSTVAEYLAMTKSQQDELKDVGGFVGGTFIGNRRKAANVLGRDILTLDLDHIPAGGTQEIIQRIRALRCAFVLYSTRKHHNGAPRIRVIILLNRTVTAEEYEAIARKIAEIIGLRYADPTTFEPARLMYWPSVNADGPYEYYYEDNGMVNADEVLAMYADWRDMTAWPAVSSGPPGPRRPAVRPTDPLLKKGVVGAFCRTYDILAAMDRFIPNVYAPCDIEDRYTYTGGSTTGGAILYDHGQHLYSHHATDPGGGKLVNAFDMVRLHLFGDQDEAVKPDTPANKYPSYIRMKHLALNDPAVSARMTREQLAEAGEDFAEIRLTGPVPPESGHPEPGPPETPADPPAPDLSWMDRLTKDGNGALQKSLQNVMLVLQHHRQLSRCVRLNLLSEKKHAAESLPWGRIQNEAAWRDEDTTELCRWLEKILGKLNRADVKHALNAIALRQAYHPIRDYLNGLVWDGQPRLDTLLIDYMGAEDNAYVRVTTRKSLIAAVARVMSPGCKFDYMLVLIGKQGRQKSTLLYLLAGGSEFFSDSLKTFEGQKAQEGVRGKWILEIADMQTFDKSDINAAKGFISQQSDYYRPAFAEETRDFKRQCVFFGTSNDVDCLRDPTGGRRFWPVVIDSNPRTKDVTTDLSAERGQIWAEAVVRWRQGESLYLPPELEAIAAKYQEYHRESHPWEEPIQEYLEMRVPENWLEWDTEKRRLFFGGGMTGEALSDAVKWVPLPYVSAQEIWEVVLGKPLGNLYPRDTRVINQILQRQPNWKKEGVQRHGAGKKLVRGYVRTNNPNG
jgi:predicted P-loop ATPase